MKILALGTYPTRRPVHGGQRRTSRIGEYYRLNGHEYRFACVYAPAAYGGDTVSEYDYPYISVGGLYSEVPFIDDIGSGVFAAQEDGPYGHFRSVVEAYEPDVIQLEQPYMWPLLKRLLDEGVCSDALIIYSSHNFEAPLKREILENVGVARDKLQRVDEMIIEQEREIIQRADLVLAVSQADAVAYDQLQSGTNAMVVRNGTDRPGKLVRPAHGLDMADGRYFFFVGSAYPPNIEGFGRFVLSEGLYGLPPEKLIAICGGASDGIYQLTNYFPHSDSYGDRVHFFARPTDAELAWLQHHARATLLPIASGGGSNLKTAEAISSCKWVVATPKALRSFEDYADRPGILVASTPGQFRDAMLEVLYGEPLKLTPAQTKKSQRLYWDALLEDSALVRRIEVLRSRNAKAGAAA